MHTLARLLTIACLTLAAAHATAATFVVTRADDPPPDACLPQDCSLREALAAAAATPEADLIELAAGQYQVTIGTLTAYGEVILRGQGSDLTRIVRGGGDHLLLVGEHGDLTVEGVELVAAGLVVGFGYVSSLTLLDVQVPESDGNWIGSSGPSAPPVQFRMRDSVLGTSLNCVQQAGLCSIEDSRIGSSIRVAGGTELRMRRSILGPESGPAGVGLVVGGTGPVSIHDSIIRNVNRPLALTQTVPAKSGPASIQRTRFLDNRGPMRSNRIGTIALQEVEISGHQAVNASGNPLNLPAALLAEDGPVWGLDKVLVVGNRGGNSEGGTVLVDSGGRVWVTNSTFDDNTFLPQASGYGHTLAVYAGGPNTTLLLFHNTLRQAASLPPDTPGTLLTVRGPTATVTVFNNALVGSCQLGSGAPVPAGQGNMTASNQGCLEVAGNHWATEPALELAGLADHGGFTRSLMPGPDSLLRDIAMTDACRVMPLDQRGHARDPDGIACDIGAVEAGAVRDAIFADGFQDD